ncbi:S-layer homology domain-containing protein [Sedimentibacter hydroxybenzoicus DSM 7310]|uniref:S-layer homology domain-containing protein n=1 Tax=Sedimentibacter hydroxybenzoicus DSM 7310 TaxID=1123245 RepID=A0A974BH21_SEDHY|nr:cyclophilin-like fold protein [Sedimentibacter hydroxybenzoicus]NYB72958.1 S-layer homology domain-containing protein [Sedimentibacter hydroxybenzoicus DSM 7310]
MKKNLFYSFGLFLIMIISFSIVNTAFADQYNDVETDAWYADAVNYVTENNLMTGTDGGGFSPDIPVTRGMMVTVLHRMEDMPTVSVNSSFSDVPENSYYAVAIAWAAENNITSGTSTDKFSPDDQISREQFAALLYRYAYMKKYDVSAYAGFDGFSDADQISPFAQNAMHWAVGSKLLGGSNGSLSPKGVTTRAQASEIFMRFMQNISGEVPAEESQGDEAAQPAMEEEMNIRITANGNTIDFRLNEIQAARDLYAQLPLTVAVENYGRNEKIFYPSQKLNTINATLADAQSGSGTLAYYSPWGNVVIFYGSSDSASGLYELGHAISGSEHIESLSGEIQIEKIETQ